MSKTASANAISYVRFSTVEQAKGASLARQTDLAKAYCEHHGLTLAEGLHDLGVSAFKGKNSKEGALGRLLKLVEDGKVKRGTYLLVESIDRISRQETMEALPVLLDLIRRGIVIVTLNDNAVYDSDALNSGKAFMLLAIIQRAHEESATKSKRLIDAWQRKRAKGKPMTNICPAWLTLSKDGQKYIPIPSAAATVNRIYQMSADGIGIRTITKTLNSEQVPTIGRADTWYDSYIKKIMESRAVIGEYAPHRGTAGNRKPTGEVWHDYYPAIVDKTLFYASKQAQKSRFKRAPGRTGNWVGLFSGLLMDELGSPWVHQNKHQHQFISEYGRRGVVGHPYASIPAESFESLALLLVIAAWQSTTSANTPTDTSKLEAELVDVQTRLAAVKESIMSGDASTLKTLISMVPQLESREAQLATEIEQANAKQGENKMAQLPSLAEEYLKTPRDIQLRTKLRQVIRNAVDQIIIGKREHVACTPVKNNDGRWVKDHAGQWVDITVKLHGAEAVQCRFFLPRRFGKPKLQFPALQEGDADVIAFALVGYRRASYHLNGQWATFTLHDEELPAPLPQTIVTIREIDGSACVHVAHTVHDNGTLEAALATDGLRLGRTLKRLGESLYAQRVLGRKGEVVKAKRVWEVLHKVNGLIVQ